MNCLQSWLGLGSKPRCILPVEPICLALKDAPVDHVAKFVQLIDDSKKKLVLAKKLQCHMIVLDVSAQVYNVNLSLTGK